MALLHGLACIIRNQHAIPNVLRRPVADQLENGLHAPLDGPVERTQVQYVHEASVLAAAGSQYRLAISIA